MAFDDDERDELAFSVARDIECQWDLYLINTYSDKELRTLDLSQVSLPQEWLLKWFEELNSVTK
ncbi:hypothetical protein EI200_21725 [Peribacillus simplex]|uniref:hypothetical protein n=1 Tax=Peribacillus simplex TaxID=1478 RepID=UPI000F641173|nr:hypothetical protein [Peribacillus simplex]RRN67738.1 hypothetical protein EI200_21725 [Peribacillus simplex]